MPRKKSVCTETFMVRISKDMLERIAKIGAADGRTKSAMMRTMLEDALPYWEEAMKKGKLRYKIR